MPPELVTARKYLGYVQLAAVSVTVGKIAFSAAKTAIQYVAKFGLRTIAKEAWQFAKGLGTWSGLAGKGRWHRSRAADPVPSKSASDFVEFHLHHPTIQRSRRNRLGSFCQVAHI